MTDTLKSFLVSIGFAVDEAGAARMAAAVKAAESKLTDATVDALGKRRDAEDKALAQRVNAIVSVNGELDAEEKAFAARHLKTRKDQEDKDLKLQDEAAKKSREKREEAFKNAEKYAVRFASLATKAVLAVEATSLGVVYAVDRAAQSFERLGYASRRIGISPQNLGAFSYAAAQTGAPGASLEEFGKNLRLFPGYRQGLERLGVKTRDGKGNLRDAGDIAVDFGDILRNRAARGGKYGYTQSVAQANAYGIDENEARALMDPTFRRQYEQKRADQARIGADPNAAAEGGTAFERSMRHFQSVVEDIATKIETSLFRNLQPQLDALGKWATNNGGKIADFVVTIADGITKLAVAFAKSQTVQDAVAGMASGLETFTKYISSDDFKKDVQGFVRDIKDIGRAIKSALQWLGIIPGSASAAEQGVTAVGEANLSVFGGAISRGGRHGPGGQGRANQQIEKFRRGEGVSALPKGQAMENARESYQFWRSKGLGHEGAMGMVAQESAESAFNPHGPPGDGGSAIGSFQWHPDRRAAIRAGTGIDVTDPKTTHRQMLEAAHWEMTKGGEQASWARLQRATSVEEGVTAGVGFERPGDRNGAIASRTAIARALEKDVQRTAAKASAVEKAAPTFGAYRDHKGTVRPVPEWAGALLKGQPAQSDRPFGDAKKSPFGALDPNAFKTHPLGVSPGQQSTISNQTRGDTTVNAPQTFNIHGGSPQANLAAARLMAGRGDRDLLRNMQAMEA